MKPDKKYMSIIDEENAFETFSVESPFKNLNSGWNPILNIDNSNFNNSRSSASFIPLNSPLEENEVDLRKQVINDVLEKSTELYSYNKVSNEDLEYNYNLPTPTDILRDFDMDLNEDELLGNLERYPYKCNSEEIFQKIRRNNPMILKTLESYRIPFPIAKTLIKRIITLTNNYCNRE
ncbi:hypothetical protein ACFO6R_15770 [Eubacterium multiforme]|uniref:Uncharacterized protein n=1 Tax=Eubacterium multiforme TaxID=83339 RepID=A0ABT9UTR5_9FIRM|nr:hypothetical protein [Eubacterium multiforme]MDQ0149685.1 hypothetical protein [Eubacterium multiforme]